ncbi:MAG: serpin family protein [Dehalococcoidia bacterium]
MKKRLVSTLIVVGAVSLATALVLSPPWDSVTPAVAETIKSDLPRIESPTTNPSQQALLIEGNSAFAFELYRQLRGEEDNLFYSPHSISVALAMTYAGAEGDTAEQMASTLRFLLEQEDLHPAFNWLDSELAARGEGAAGKEGEGFRLNIVNAIWGQKDYSFLESFLDVLAENYGAGLKILDFIEEAEASRLAINKWVSDETEGRIEQLIPRGAIDELTRLVITNAIYFDAAWKYPFDKGTDGPFYLLDGQQVTVLMMRQSQSLGYARGQGHQAVELLYDSGELSMVILLPDSGRFREFEDDLDAHSVAATINSLRRTRVALTMPKFEFESDLDLKYTLQAMGMSDAFTWNTADFSGMTGGRDLFISDVVHKAFVSVDEEGTEAAAATGVIMAPTAMPPDPDVAVTIDRPFIFLIRDMETGAILFIGRVMNPTD